MCQINMAGPRGAHRADKTLYLGVSVRVFPEEISIGISRLSKEDPPSPLLMGTTQSPEALNRTKAAGRRNLLSRLSCRSIFSCPWTLVLLVLKSLDLNQGVRPSGFSGAPACR